MKKRTKKAKVVVNLDDYRVGAKVTHEKFGPGVIVTRERVSPPNPFTADLRHRNEVNIGVKFAGGGPQGWAENATHDITQLKVVA